MFIWQYECMSLDKDGKIFLWFLGVRLVGKLSAVFPRYTQYLQKEGNYYSSSLLGGWFILYLNLLLMFQIISHAAFGQETEDVYVSKQQGWGGEGEKLLTSWSFTGLCWRIIQVESFLVVMITFINMDNTIMIPIA